MGNETADDPRPDATDPSGEKKLRGDALDGSEQQRAVDHSAYKKKTNPDTVVRVDNEKDSLYTDGLELDAEAVPLGTPRGDDNSR
jgi:hypothetical protein